jgi:hypothetical protein
MTTEDIDHTQDQTAVLLAKLVSVAESIRFILLFWSFLTVIGAIVLVANR